MRYFVEWLALQGILSHVRTARIELAYERTRRLARIGRRVLRREWRWALRNLELVFGPNLSPQARHRLAARAFEEHFLSYLEGLRARDIDVTLEGGERLHAAMERGKGVIGACVHLGSWEAALDAPLSGGLSAAAVYRPADNPRNEKVIRSARAQSAAEWIQKTDMRGMMRCLAQGKLLYMLVDLNMTEGGIPVPFLGAPAMSPPGPAKLALRFGSPIVPFMPVRTGEGRATLHAGDVLDPADSLAEADPVTHVMQRIHERLEPWIIEYAEQYNWLHPRWRTRPTGRPWTLRDPIESLWKERTAPFADVPERVMRMLE